MEEINLLAHKKAVGKKQKRLIDISLFAITILSWYFLFFFYNFTLAGNIIVYNPTQGTIREKYSYKYIIKGWNADSGVKNTLPAISSLLGRVLSIFRRKTHGPHLSEMDIKVLIPVPTFLPKLE